ncbi:hypothetical protein OG800_50440 (plasmid) [Streptomyces sp. NBC_00445]
MTSSQLLIRRETTTDALQPLPRLGDPHPRCAAQTSRLEESSW